MCKIGCKATAFYGRINFTVFGSLQENLTEALADLDAALEKELHSGEQEPIQQTNESHSKVEELEKQCKTLENELDTVKGCYLFYFSTPLTDFFTENSFINFVK